MVGVACGVLSLLDRCWQYNRCGIGAFLFGPSDLHFAHIDQEGVSLPEVRDAVAVLNVLA